MTVATPTILIWQQLLSRPRRVANVQILVISIDLSSVNLARVYENPLSPAVIYVLSTSLRQTASSMKPSGSSQNVA